MHSDSLLLLIAVETQSIKIGLLDHNYPFAILTILHNLEERAIEAKAIRFPMI
jgi:hypothetical protein